MILFISGAELVFVFFIVLLVFGADKIPSIAKGLAKGMTQIKHATNEIKTEIIDSLDNDNMINDDGQIDPNDIQKVNDVTEKLGNKIQDDIFLIRIILYYTVKYVKIG
mgnify:CR=1 FL=1